MACTVGGLRPRTSEGLGFEEYAGRIQAPLIYFQGFHAIHKLSSCVFWIVIFSLPHR